jgi:hypothetical protein
MNLGAIRPTTVILRAVASKPRVWRRTRVSGPIEGSGRSRGVKDQLFGVLRSVLKVSVLVKALGGVTLWASSATSSSVEGNGDSSAVLPPTRRMATRFVISHAFSLPGSGASAVIPIPTAPSRRGPDVGVLVGEAHQQGGGHLRRISAASARTAADRTSKSRQ